VNPAQQSNFLFRCFRLAFSAVSAKDQSLPFFQIPAVPIFFRKNDHGSVSEYDLRGVAPMYGSGFSSKASNYFIAQSKKSPKAACRPIS
jgi:hypothetical protein